MTVAPRGRPRTSLVVLVALGCVGVGLTGIVALDGTWPWRIVRMLLVGAVVSRAMSAARRPARPVPFGLAAFAVGSVAFPVGATIALSYFRTTGVSVKAFAGALTACAATVLLVVGGIALWRALRWRGRALAVVLALALGYSMGFSLVVAVYATNVPRPALGHTTPADHGVHYRDVTFTTVDSVRLSGWYIPSRNRAAVVFLHGASSTRSNVLDQALVVARHGYGVLLFDARGHGRSAGRAMEFGWYGDQDTSAAVAFVRRQPDVDPQRVGALGISMGGEEAVGAMAHDHGIRAVVAEGATNRVAGDWNWLADRYGLRGQVQRLVHWFTYRLTDAFTDADPPMTLRAAVRTASPRRVLLIAAGNVADEESADSSIRAASPRTVSVWVARGAEHGGALHAQPAEWERRVTDFFAATLLGS